MSSATISYDPCSPGKAALQTLLFLLLFLSVQPAIAQQPNYEEITVELHVPDAGDTVIAALLNNETAWLSVEDIFRFIRINYSIPFSGESISGFFLTTETKYLLDNREQILNFNRSVTPLPAGTLLLHNRRLYLQANMFSKLFRLDCRFIYRSMTVNLTTTLELQAVKERKLAQIRNNLNKYKNEQKADTIIDRAYNAFRMGMADWSVNSTIDFKGRGDTRANMALGSVILGGEATVVIQYNNQNGFDRRQQYYNWRYINNETPWLRQTSLGKISPNAIASIFAPVVGIQLSNTPTTLRKSFGTYRLNRYTQPGWMVELYVNNTLLDYTRADASGFFSFDIPIVYGNTQVQVKYYGPNGEQQMDMASITMPYGFLPKGEWEYNLNAGLVEDSVFSRYAKTQVSYGITPGITVGTGIEYLSSIPSRKDLPFLTTNFRIGRNMIFTVLYTHEVKSSLTGNYRLAGNLLFELNYVRYTKGQKAINNTYLEERGVTVSFPFRIKRSSSYARFSFYQILLPETRYTTIEAMFTGMVWNTSTNFTTYALVTGNNQAYLYSNLSVMVRLPARFTLNPQLQYEYNSNRFISMKGEIEKRISTRGYINAYFENNFKSRFRSFNLGIRYDLRYMQAGYAFRKSSSGNLSLITALRGSILHDSRTGYIGFSNHQSVGRGGIIIESFLDMNNNRRKDAGEPKVKGLKLNFTGGIREENKKDTTIIIRNLEAYNSYLLVIDKNSFEEIAWQVKTGSVKVEISPNQFQLLEIPIAVSGEVSGTIYIQDNKEKKTLGRIQVNIYDHSGQLVAQTLSEIDGYYSYLGLPPGIYSIKPNPGQLQKLNLQLFPAVWRFEIEPEIHGDVHRKLDFILSPRK